MLRKTKLIKDYYTLTKPGIIYGNALTASAGFFLASRGAVDLWLLLATVAGLSLVIASACVFNNYVDRDIDALMERTRDRALASRRLSTKSALIFGSILGALGFATLLFYTNPLACLVALLGFVVYVALYTPLKRRSGHALFVGAVAGATPPVVGYAAAAGVLDISALWLFIFLFLWQLPHFIAISVYRADEYAAAGVPLLLGRRTYTKRQKNIAHAVFYFSLVVLLAWCAALLLYSFSAPR